MKVRDEIDKYSREEDKDVLNWLLDRYSWNTKWQFVAVCSFDRYGDRVWRPTIEGLILYRNLCDMVAGEI